MAFSGFGSPPSAALTSALGTSAGVVGGTSATDTVVARPEYGVQAGAPASPGSTGGLRASAQSVETFSRAGPA